jgi:long-subunit acyl-CoA synthetase (AMP-forming)
VYPHGNQLVADQPGHETIRETLAQPSLARAFLASAQSNRGRVALREFGSPETLTYSEWLTRSRAVAGGLERLGLRKGDRVGLLLSNRLEFHIVDVGAMLLGAASFSLYNTAPLEQLLYYADNAEPSVVIAEPELAERARELVAARPGIRLVVLDDAREGELSLAELEASCPESFDIEGAAARVQPEDLLTLVYTSGTTGHPKGVQYVHSGVMFTLQTFQARLPVSPEGRNISYLPMAHIAERLLGHYAGFGYGYTITSLPDPKQLQEALLAVRPTRFFGVPRIYEKVEAAMLRVIDQSEQDRAAELRHALEAGVERVRTEQAGQPRPATPPDDQDLLTTLAQATGLDRAEWLGVSGAPCDRALMERFHAVGLRLSELWGMSESIIGSSAAPDRIRLGAAGYPFDGFEIRLGDDGEILVRSPSVTPGYFKDPERTRESITEDGWLHTGDLARFDDDGYLSVVGRKKDIIINSAGKNMSPANIEQTIRGTDPLIANVVCVGDARPYNVGLIVLDAQGAATFAADHGIPPAPVAELARDPQVREHVAALVRDGNARLSRVEQLKRFAILEREWLPGGDELTLTNKLKRSSVIEKYADQIDSLYAAPRTTPETSAPGG